MYLENYKTVIKEIEDDTNRWKDIDILCSQIGSINGYNDYNTQDNLQIQYNPYENTNGIIHRTRTNNSKICMESQMTPNSQSN